jgi:hypothetical protein
VDQNRSDVSLTAQYVSLWLQHNDAILIRRKLLQSAGLVLVALDFLPPSIRQRPCHTLLSYPSPDCMSLSGFALNGRIV